MRRTMPAYRYALHTYFMRFEFHHLNRLDAEYHDAPIQIDFFISFGYRSFEKHTKIVYLVCESTEFGLIFQRYSIDFRMRINELPSKNLW